MLRVLSCSRVQCNIQRLESGELIFGTLNRLYGSPCIRCRSLSRIFTARARGTQRKNQNGLVDPRFELFSDISLDDASKGSHPLQCQPYDSYRFERSCPGPFEYAVCRTRSRHNNDDTHVRRCNDDNCCDTEPQRPKELNNSTDMLV